MKEIKSKSVTRTTWVQKRCYNGHTTTSVYRNNVLLLPLHLLLCLSLSPPDKSIQLAMLGLRAHFLSMGRKKQFICPFWLLWWWEPGFHQDSHQELLKHKKGMLGNPTPTKDKCPTTNTVFSIKTCRRNIW